MKIKRGHKSVWISCIEAELFRAREALDEQRVPKVGVEIIDLQAQAGFHAAVRARKIQALVRDERANGAVAGKQFPRRAVEQRPDYRGIVTRRERRRAFPVVI